MIPSALITQLEEGMEDFLRASFWSSSPPFQGLMDRFLDRRESLFKGPFVAMHLPFKQGLNPSPFAKVPLKYPPYAHQERAFERIGAGKNTIVATGTGSGKTECFALPLLAYCAEHLSDRGIKAILLYPMNALANDQAERLAELVWENPLLKGNLNVGMYVGDSGGGGHTSMGPKHVITDHTIMRNNPPDILLTNYKMLDYLLLRPEDKRLWRDNGTETLKFLVVDELHTFDGAQGTDLACLLRRLRARLNTPEGHLCCVGTSATLSSDKNASEALLDYATQVFGSSFELDSVVREMRLDSREFFGDALIEAEPLAMPAIDELDPRSYVDSDAFVAGQMRLWFGGELEAAALGAELLMNIPFRNLVTLYDSRDLYRLDELAEMLFRKLDRPLEYKRLYTLSLLALVSHARRENGLPFVQIRIQLWQREMRRMVASVGHLPDLDFYDDLPLEKKRSHLPVVYCRDCGLMGWTALVHSESKSQLAGDLHDLYQAYFDGDKRVEFLFVDDAYTDGAWARKVQKFWVNTSSLMRQTMLEDDAEGFVQVLMPESTHMTGKGQRLNRDCPQCDAPDALSLLGYQAATLTSTYIGQLFTSRFNDDRRLLAFSDSVQDAAHRAGFFGARTWNFNIRVAIQEVVTSKAEGLTLAELADLVPAYWLQKLGPLEFVGRFMPPNLEWLEEYETFRARGELKNDGLQKLVARRMRWEVYQEYTFRSAIGRTLERSGSSAVGVDQSLFDDAVDRTIMALKEELKIDLSVEAVRHLLLGFVIRMRSRGAVFNADVPAQYMETGGKTFMFNKTLHLPNAGPGSRLPVFWTNQAGTDRFEFATALSGWPVRWVNRLLEQTQFLKTPYAREVVELTLKAMVDAGLVEARAEAPGLWGLKMEALRVTSDLVPMRASKARVRAWVPAWEASIWREMPALTQVLGGVWEPLQDAMAHHRSYYAQLYATGEVVRVNAAEHTGLLERETREQVEASFKSDPQHPWDINLLSCTPTLEMGIDIGQLSSAILCSVPPGVANFLQRVGRAERKDGNAIILTIANAREHDLYFFSKPEEMLAGNVEPPGVFLNASAVLSRQLTAFCLDKWISNNELNAKDFPKVLSEVIRGLKGDHSLNKFPHNFISYVEAHQTLLLQGFFSLFDTMSEDTIKAVTDFMRGAKGDEGSLGWTLLNHLQRLRLEFEDRDSDHKKLSKRIQKLEALPTRSPAEEEEVMELRRERSAIRRLAENLSQRPLLQVLSDEGLIPNYAFPEAGVSLKSIIWKRVGDDFQNLEFKYERPARSAIVELAPDARFYAGGRRVRVNQVDIRRSVPEKWRFCPACTYAEVAIGQSPKSCPSCKSPGLGDTGQEMQMVKLTQVYAWTKDADSRIDDERDEREPLFFNRQMLVSFPAEQNTIAWHINNDELPFGAEYMPSAVFREINFGPRKADGTVLKVAGVVRARWVRGLHVVRHGAGQNQEPARAELSVQARAGEGAQGEGALSLPRV